MDIFELDKKSSGMPRQKLSYRFKNEEWRKQCVDSVINLCNTNQGKRRSSNAQKKRNYDLFNNKISKLDFSNATNPLGFSADELARMQMPATIQPYDIISPVFMYLFGEEAKRVFSPVVRAINESAISWKEEQKKNELMQALQQFLMDQEADDSFVEETLKKYEGYSPKDIREIKTQRLLGYLIKHEKLNTIFSKAWKDALIAGEEIYSVDEIAGAPKCRRVNPLEVNYIVSENSDYIDESEKIYEKNKMTISDIIDEFYEYLTPDQIDDLERRSQGFETLYSYDSDSPTVNDFFPQTGIPVINSIDDFSTGEGGINVHRVRWKSKRKIGILHYIDSNNEEQQMLVDEVYKIDKKDPSTFIEYFWINEYWEGVRIGQDMYPIIRPRKNQFRNIDNISECKSGYVGTIYNSLNSQSVSLMDRLVPWIYLYLITMYRIELLMAANMGKMAIIDISLIPDGWETEKFLYYANAFKIMFVNSFNEGLKGERKGTQNQSTQNKQLDMELGQSVIFNLKVLETLEKKIEDTSGVTRQRKGDTQTSEAVGNVQSSIIQSSTITEPWFQMHNLTKVRVCEHLVRIAQDCLEDKNKSYLYVTDDMETIADTIEAGSISDADMGVFITDSQKDNEIRETFKKYLNEAIQNDKLDFSMIADIISSESTAELKNAIKQGELARIEREQANLQADRETQLQIHNEQLQLEYDKMDREDLNNQLDRENKLYIEEMKAQAFDEGDDGIDISAIADNALAQQEIQLAHIIEQSTLSQEEKQHLREMRIKEKEIKMKLEVENKKLQQVEKQNKNQIELANKKAKLDEKMMQQKMKLEAMKTKAAIAKSKAAAKKPKPKK